MKTAKLFGAMLMVSATLAAFGSNNSYAQSRRGSEGSGRSSHRVESRGAERRGSMQATRPGTRPSSGRPAVKPQKPTASAPAHRPADRPQRPTASAPAHRPQRPMASAPTHRPADRPHGSYHPAHRPAYRPAPRHVYHPAPRPVYHPHFCIHHPRPCFGVRYVRQVSWPAPIVIYVRSTPYYYDRGVFYIDKGNEYYETVAPPVGAIVPEIPDDYTIVVIDGQEYYQVDRTYYKLIEYNGAAAFQVVG